MRARRILIAVGVVAVVAIVVALGFAAMQRTTSQPPGKPPPEPATGQARPEPQAGSPVLAVKIDNLSIARPPVGIGAADLIYVEPVEGGLSRVAAIFSSHTPPVVGPVRSARETDLELLPQFGDPTLAYSGAAPELLPLIAGASVRDASADRIPGSYFRDNNREVPHNLFAHTDQLPPGAPWAPGSQLTFGPPPAGGVPAGHQEVRYKAATIGFDWSPQENRYLASMDGAPYAAADSGRLGASTVVLQTVPVRESQFKDVAGSFSPFAETVGTGRAVILRDGQAFEATWNRPSVTAGTTYTTPSGAPLPFAPGQVWTVLVPG